MTTILIVDDDVNIRNLVAEALEREGYAVQKAASGTEALRQIAQEKPDLVLLDLMLPGLSGEAVLPDIRDIPVIVMSAKADVADKVGLLLGGAADYVTKPFDLQELLARITVQLRKSQQKEMQFQNLRLYADTLTVQVGDTPVRLTRTECAILKLLMQNPDVPVGKSTILEKISMDTPDCTERSLKQHISNIRHKLQAAGGRDYIEAIYGIGFKMKS